VSIATAPAGASDTGRQLRHQRTHMESFEVSDVVTKHGAHTVPETVGSLVELIRARELRLFSLIDQREAARSVGLDLRDTVLVVFGSPTTGTPIMAAAPLAALDLPLKVLVWDDGERTCISYVAPHALAERHNLSPELAGPLAGLDAITDALVVT
jgi:uncharacterized protein (DUF302 family)